LSRICPVAVFTSQNMSSGSALPAVVVCESAVIVASIVASKRTMVAHAGRGSLSTVNARQFCRAAGVTFRSRISWVAL